MEEIPHSNFERDEIWNFKGRKKYSKIIIIILFSLFKWELSVYLLLLLLFKILASCLYFNVLGLSAQMFQKVILKVTVMNIDAQMYNLKPNGLGSNWQSKSPTVVYWLERLHSNLDSFVSSKCAQCIYSLQY